MIREVKRDELSACADLIRRSFQTVADEFGFTRENAPRFTAFAATEEQLLWHMDGEHRLMYLYEEGGRPCGYYSLLLRDQGSCELGSLSVLPEYRHSGIGGKLLQHAVKTAEVQGCTVMNLSIVEENTVLRKWYERHGAIHTGIKKFDFFPFTCGYMKIVLPETGKTMLKKKLPVVPDDRHCLVNLSNSVLKKFGAETTAETLPLADQYLQKQYRNIVVLLLDGMGTAILEKHLDPNGFFRSHLAGSFDSVYPPTTVAATTSVLSGLYPNEHGWLGWAVYYPQVGKNVTVFTNTEQLREKEGVAPTAQYPDGSARWTEDSLEETLPAAEYNVAFRYTPYKNILDKIKEAGGEAYAAMPFLPPYPQSMEAILNRVKELCDKPGKKFIYAYWNEPDATMHRTGTVSDAAHAMVTGLEKTVEEAVSGLSDTLLMIIADHGHMDSRNACLKDHPEVMNCLVRRPSFEPRTLNLFVKDEYKESFPEIFRKHFGDSFILLTRDEVLSGKLFGIGKNHECLESMIGDYVALAVSDRSLFNTHMEAQEMPGGHAGLTPEEIKIPLIVIET